MTHAALALVFVACCVAVGALGLRVGARTTLPAAMILAAVAVVAHVVELLLA